MKVHFMKPTMRLRVLRIGLKVLNLLLSACFLFLTASLAFQIRDNRPVDSVILIPGSIAFIAWFGFGVGLFFKKYWAWLGTVISMPLSALALGWIVFGYEFMPNLPFVWLGPGNSFFFMIWPGYIGWCVCALVVLYFLIVTRRDYLSRPQSVEPPFYDSPPTDGNGRANIT